MGVGDDNDKGNNFYSEDSSEDNSDGNSDGDSHGDNYVGPFFLQTKTTTFSVKCNSNLLVRPEQGGTKIMS